MRVGLGDLLYFMGGILVGLLLAQATPWRLVIRQAPLPAPAPVVVVAPESFGVFSVQSERDASHTIPVGLSGGRVWFRQESPGVSLGMIDLANIRLTGARRDRLVCPIAAPQERIARWVSEHEGGEAVVVFQSKPIGEPFPITRKLGEEVTAQFDSAAAAQRALTDLRSLVQVSQRE